MDARSMLPESRLGRVRMVLLGFSLLVMLLSLGQLEPHSSVVGVSVVADLFLVGILVGTAVHRSHVTVWEAPATAALCVLVGIGQHSPLLVGITAMGVVLSQTLYGTLVNDIVRAVSFIPVYSLATQFTQIPHEKITWYSHAVLTGAPVVPLMVAVVASLRGSLLAQEQTLIRSHFLGTLTAELLGAPDPRTISGIMKRASDAICDVVPGMVAIAIRRTPAGQPGAGGARVTGVHGPGSDAFPKSVPAEALAPLDAEQVEMYGELRGGTRSMAAAGFPKHRTWRVDPILAPPEVIAIIDVDTMLWGVPQCFSERFLGIPGAQGAEALELLEAYNRHGMQATENSVRNATLLHEARHDATTGAANRESLLRRLSDLSGNGTPCAVALSEVGDLRGLAARQGLRAWRQVMTQHGERVAAIAEGFAGAAPGTFVARPTDNSMCVVLPDHPELAETLRAELSERLAEPYTVLDEQVSMRTTVVALTTDAGADPLEALAPGFTSLFSAHDRARSQEA